MIIGIVGGKEVRKVRISGFIRVNETKILAYPNAITSSCPQASIYAVILKSIRLRNFRAHENSEIQFDDRANLLVGPNGAGKTNILEAIYMMCLSRSFLTSSDRYVLRKDAPHFEIEGVFESEKRGPIKVRVAFVPGEGKKIFVGGAPLDRFSELVGRFPVVIFSPEDQQLTSDGPEVRRRFLDNIISQTSSVYLDHLLRYGKALKQRNELLQISRKRRTAPDPMLPESWTEELIRHGSHLILARHKFVTDFSNHLESAYQKIGTVVERPSLSYDPFSDTSLQQLDLIKSDQSGADIVWSIDRIQDLFRIEIARKAASERDRGITLVGPHRDDLEMSLGLLPVRRFASQGQHRTFGMSMKLAQYEYLKERNSEKPILLLDDVFDNLDPMRIGAFLDILGSNAIGQSITTAARKEIVHDHLNGMSCHTIEVCSGGHVQPSLLEIALEL